MPLLAEHFLSMVAQREGREAKRFDDEALSILKEYHWPGNVRELQNICERASVLCRDSVIEGGLIQPWLMPRGSATPLVHQSAAPAAMTTLAGSPPLQPPAVVASPDAGGPLRSLEEIEREEVIRALGRFSGNRTRTAQALGIGVRTLGLKLKKWKEQNLVAQSV